MYLIVITMIDFDIFNNIVDGLFIVLFLCCIYIIYLFHVFAFIAILILIMLYIIGLIATMIRYTIKQVKEKIK